jgi:hypothetical protein
MLASRGAPQAGRAGSGRSGQRRRPATAPHGRSGSSRSAGGWSVCGGSSRGPHERAIGVAGHPVCRTCLAQPHYATGKWSSECPRCVKSAPRSCCTGRRKQVTLTFGLLMIRVRRGHSPGALWVHASPHYVAQYGTLVLIVILTEATRQDLGGSRHDSPLARGLGAGRRAGAMRISCSGGVLDPASSAPRARARSSARAGNGWSAQTGSPLPDIVSVVRMPSDPGAPSLPPAPPGAGSIFRT